MEIISLRIRTKDAEYGRVLQEVLKRNYPGFLISQEEILPCEEESAEEPAGSWGIDLSLCDDKHSLRDGEVLLVEQPSADTVPLWREGLDRYKPGSMRAAEKESGGEVNACIFKYTPAREMIEKILQLCAAGMNRPIFHQRESGARLVGVFAAAGGRGCTTVSLALAQYGARLRGEHALVVPMAQFPGAASFSPSPGVMPLREYVFRVLRAGAVCSAGEAGRYDHAGLLERAVRADAFGNGFFCPGAEAAENPLTGLSASGMQTLLYAMTEGLYRTLIIDIGTVMNEASMTVLRAADRLVMLMGEDEDDRIYREYLRSRCGGGVLSKMIPVRNAVHEAASGPLLAVKAFLDAPGQAEKSSGGPREKDGGKGAVLEDRAPAAVIPFDRGIGGRVFPLEGGFAEAAESVLLALDAPLHIS